MEKCQSKNVFSKYFTSALKSYKTSFIDDEDKLARSRRNILYYNLTETFVTIFANGVFLTGLILYMFRNEPSAVQNEHLGTIISVSSLAAFFQILTPLFASRLKSYRRIMVFLRFVYYLLNTFGLAIVPVLPIPTIAKAVLFAAILFAIRLSQAVLSPLICAWHIGSMPDSIRSDIMSTRQLLFTVFNVVVTLLASALIDWLEPKGLYFSAILIIRGLFIVIAGWEFYAIKNIAEPLDSYNPCKIKLYSVFIEPFKYKSYIMVLLFSCAWTFGSGFSANYFNAYLLNTAKIPYTIINLGNITTIPLMILLLPFWNKCVKKFGWMTTAGIAAFCYIVPFIINLFVTKNLQYLCVVSTILSQIAGLGMGLVSNNLTFLKLPKKVNQVAFISFYSAVSAFMSFLSSFCAKRFIKYTNGIKLDFFGRSIINTQYIMLVTVVFTAFCVFLAFSINKSDKKQADNS